MATFSLGAPGPGGGFSAGNRERRGASFRPTSTTATGGTAEGEEAVELIGRERVRSGGEEESASVSP